MVALEGGEVKRSRKQIVTQLVRQELVEDRKSLLKKPAKKKMVSHILPAIAETIGHIYILMPPGIMSL